MRIRCSNAETCGQRKASYLDDRSAEPFGTFGHPMPPDVPSRLEKSLDPGHSAPNPAMSGPKIKAWFPACAIPKNGLSSVVKKPTDGLK